MSGCSPANRNLGVGLLVEIWTIVPVALIAVLLRLYVRGLRRHNLGLDDGLILFAVIISLFAAICGSFAVHYGLGRHIEYLQAHQVAEIMKWLTFAELSSFACLFFLRASIAVFLLRVLGVTRKKSRWTLYGATLLNAIVTLITIVIFVVRCIPLQAVWDSSVHATCFSKQILSDAIRASGSLSVIIDFITAGLPLLVVGQLQMGGKQKAGFCAITTLALITAACSIGKIITANEDTDDPTWILVQPSFWVIAEQNLGTILACIPSMRQIYQALVEDHHKIMQFFRRRNVSIENEDLDLKPSLAIRGDSQQKLTQAMAMPGYTNKPLPRNPPSDNSITQLREISVEIV